MKQLEFKLKENDYFQYLCTARVFYPRALGRNPRLVAHFFEASDSKSKGGFFNVKCFITYSFLLVERTICLILFDCAYDKLLCSCVKL